MENGTSKANGRIRRMWRYRWLALPAALLVGLLGGGLVYSLPNIYEASTRVYVDTETVLGPLLKGLATETNVMDEVTIMARSLLSRNHLQEVARETDMDLRADTAREMEKLIESLRAAISISGGSDRLYTITYQDKDPRIAFGVVQAMLSTFMGNTLGSRRDDFAEATRFLEDRVREYARRLGDAEQRLAQFKQVNPVVMTPAGAFYDRLQASRATLARLESEQRVAERAREVLLRQLEGEKLSFGLSADSRPLAASETDVQIANLKNQLDMPDDAPRGPDISRLDMNPVYQSIKIELNQTEVQIARLTEQIAQHRAALALLQKSIDTIPEIEAELSRLTRDNKVMKNRYEDLFERLEQARLTQTAGQNTEGIQFRVIDPPVPPLEPVGPNRVLLLSIVLLFSLAFGAAVAFLLDHNRSHSGLVK